MLLALRKDAPVGASIWQRISCWVIKARLASQWCHGGIVINGAMYHTTATNGLHRLSPGEWTPERWDLFALDCDDDFALAEFDARKGAKYDWLGLLSFVGADIYTRDKLYCFEWCWIAMRQTGHRHKITPELLLLARLANLRS